MSETVTISNESLPAAPKAFAGAFMTLGVLVAIAGFGFGVSKIAVGGDGVRALQDISTGIGSAVVALYGLFITKRKRIALGRWWFLAAWAMNLITPIGLFFFALIIASTLTLRKKYPQVFRAS